MQRFSPIQYLKIDIANSYGLDKLTWDERIAWFDSIKDGNIAELIPQAKEPAMFYAGCKAYNDALAGKPSGYMISLDATSSGLQLLAALTGCRQSAELCNVVPFRFHDDSVVQRQDGYTVIYNMMLDELGEESKIKRDDVKQAIMTSLYSSRAVPRQVFGEGALLDLFYDTMTEAAPGAWELNEAMLSFWDSKALSHDWVLPDNFHVKIKVMDSIKETVHFLNQPFEVFHKVNRPMKEGRSLGANATHSIDGMICREMGERCDYNTEKVNKLYDLLAVEAPVPVYGHGTKTNDDKLVVVLWEHYKNCGYLSARIINALNADNLGHVDPAVIWELLESLPEKPFKVLSVHDCFRCHPNYANDLRIQYARQLMLIAKSDLLSYLISQIIGRTVQIGKLDLEMWQDIEETEYALS